MSQEKEKKEENKEKEKNSSNVNPDPKTEKSPLAEREEEILKFWKEKRIFEKTLRKDSPEGEFIFYEGPPTANGRPGIHHLIPRSFKDLIPRYKTMRGYSVRRKGGWDTHGLPVELEVEKELGLKSKREIEEYGIDKFNQKCKESVWKYISEWEEFTDRIGYWIDLDHPYVTYKPYYIESLWNIVKKVDERNLLYKDYKVLPWCPRCGTALSSHELAQGYSTVKDLSLTVKFQITSSEIQTNSKFQIPNQSKVKGQRSNVYLLAWTTTPWTLPGNVALAVGKDVKYGFYEKDGEVLVVAKDRREILGEGYKEITCFTGENLIGLEYKPMYPFLKEGLSESEKEKSERAFKVYSADFVNTEDGTGIVHTAVMYGQDDFELGTKENLPKHHLVNEDGTFKEGAGFLAGKFVKDQETDVEIIKDLAHRNLLFKKEKYEHSYPHCWRCKTPLIYYARDSWYIRMSELRDKLIAENEKINWQPEHLKQGRFGEWLKDVKDWAISRERYWGTPLPVWQCSFCEKREVIGSFEEIFLKNPDKKITKIIAIRHGESEKNIKELFDSDKDAYPLTSQGKDQAKEAGEQLKSQKVDAIYTSPVRRARETAEIIGKIAGLETIEDDRLWEVKNGEWEGKTIDDPSILDEKIAYNKLPNEEYYQAKRGKTGENWSDVEKRIVDLAKEILEKHQGETVVMVSHEGTLMMLLKYLKDLSLSEIVNLWDERRSWNGEQSDHQGLLGGYAEPAYVYLDSRTGKEIDPHRPVIDEIKLVCECGEEMSRVKEVMDVWFDSGAIPFAQDHYPFKNKEWVDEKGYPADFISEAIDQTRGWFYTSHAVGALMDKGLAYKNIISLGHLLDAEGKKMSKSIGNVVDPWKAADKYGVDVLRFWMYSVNQPGDSKNFDEKSVEEVVRKVPNLLLNIVKFYEMYKHDTNLQMKANDANKVSENVLDRWILAYLNSLINSCRENLDNYKTFEPARDIKDFIADFSQWYIRRSRDRFKGEDKEDAKSALETTRFVLLEFSKVLAPFMPFLAEDIYQRVKPKPDTNTRMNTNDTNGWKESVHLEEWPEVKSKINPPAGGQKSNILEEMEEVRRIVSLGLEARARAGIKVRQPLLTLRVKNDELGIMNNDSLTELIKDEVNVKEVIFDKNISEEVELDQEITPELKLEGRVREFVRHLQGLRKKANLNPDDLVEIKIETDQPGKNFIEKFKEEISNSTALKEINFGEVSEGEEIKVDEMSFKAKFQS